MTKKELVTSLIKKNRSRKFTAETLTNTINQDLPRNSHVTLLQVRTCLTRLANSNMITKLPLKTKDTKGRSVSQWKFNRS